MAHTPVACCEFEELSPPAVMLERPLDIPRDCPEHAPETLGLSFSPRGRLKVSHFVGQVWIKAGGEPLFPLQVNPKRSENGRRVDFLAMAAKCFEDSTVAAHMGRCFHFWPDEAPLESDLARDFRLLIVGMYCQALASLCKRHLRKEFVRVTENLAGRIKGRILVGENLRRNLCRGRKDRTVCQFQVHSLDSPENQILRAALEQSLKELRHAGGVDGLGQLLEWARISDAALAGIGLRRIHPAEFRSLRLGGLKRAYKRPIELARLVLALLGSDPTLERKIQTPPFAIDMNELFERYCEVELRKDYGDSLWVGYHDNNLGEKLKVRPDFIDTRNGVVIDAKYKYDWPTGPFDSTSEGTRRWDVLQVLGYSRHAHVLRTFDAPGECHVEIHYPSFEEAKRSEPLSGDLKSCLLHAVAVQLPQTEE